MKKKISLIVPALSTNSYIEDIIVNILHWTKLPSEIIIVNSSDKDYRIEMAYDLMAIDIKENIQTYSIDYSNEK